MRRGRSHTTPQIQRSSSVRAVLSSALLLLALLSSTAYAQGGAGLVTRMDELRAEIELGEQSLATARAFTAELQKQLNTLRAELQKLRTEERNLALERDRLSRRSNELSQRQTRLAHERSAIKDRLRARLRAAYLSPPSLVFTDLVAPGGPSERETQAPIPFALVSRYLDRLYENDRRLSERLKGVEGTLRSEGQELLEVKRKQEEATKQYTIRQQRVRERVAAQDRIVAESKAEQAKAEELVASLRTKLLRFEATLAGLTGGVYTDDTEQESSLISNANETSASDRDIPYQGEGFKRGAQISSPVSGANIVTRFGGRRRDQQASKGLEYDTKGLAPIRAIGPGRVVYIGRLPGLDEVVVVDHGARCFSLYGRLGSIEVRGGQELQKGQVIGEARGDVPFYLELRREGQPFDPLKVIR